MIRRCTDSHPLYRSFAHRSFFAAPPTNKMDMVPPSVKKVEKAMEAMISDIQKQYLLPKQKDAFLCCAKCCDVSDDLQALQGW